jgi:cell division protein ZapD
MIAMARTAPTRAPEAQTTSEPVCYEQPLNERMRSFMRLEFLFRQSDHALAGQSVWDSRAAMSALIEILHIFGRTDLKTEVMKELERHTANLARLEQNPNVDHRLLEGVLDELDALIDRLHSASGQMALHLKQNDFLTTILQRSGIPGGACDFDLPAYHHWLQRPATERGHMLRTWLSTFDAVRASVELILRLTRQSAAAQHCLAKAGFFQKTIELGQPCQMVRVLLPQDSPYYAEISGGRHRFTVRFLETRDLAQRAAQTSHDLAFDLACCII